MTNQELFFVWLWSIAASVPVKRDYLLGALHWSRFNKAYDTEFEEDCYLLAQILIHHL